MTAILRYVCVPLAALMLLAGCAKTRPVSHDPYDGPLVRDNGTPVVAPSW